MDEAVRYLADPSSMPDIKKKLLKVPKSQMIDNQKLINAVNQVCKKFSKAALIEMFRLGHDKKTRTCIVYSAVDRQIEFNMEGEYNWVSVKKLVVSVSQ